MACFAVPAAVGILVHSQRKKFPAHWHIGWLTTIIFGGAIGLAVEHIAHGELVPWPPFLTAMSSPADTAAMLHEMAWVGIPMTLALVLAWAVMVAAYHKSPVLRKALAASPAAF